MAIQLILVAALASLALANPLSQDPKLYKEAKEFCIKDLNIRSKKYGGGVDKTDPNYKCFNFCFQKKVGMLDEHANPIMTAIPAESNSTDVVEACAKDNKEINYCDKATWIRECVKTRMIEKLEKQLAIISDICSKETNTPVSDYPTMKKQALVNIYNQTLNCYHRCILIKTHAIDEDNNYKVSHIDKMTKDVGISGIDQMIKNCVNNNAQPDKCEQAVKRSICVGSNAFMKYTFSSRKVKGDAELLY